MVKQAWNRIFLSFLENIQGIMVIAINLDRKKQGSIQFWREWLFPMNKNPLGNNHSRFKIPTKLVTHYHSFHPHSIKPSRTSWEIVAKYPWTVQAIMEVHLRLLRTGICNQILRRITYLASLRCSAHGVFNGVPLTDIQRDWHALLHGLSL